MTAPSVLTFIALADELNRVMSALQGIANGNVGAPMEYAQKTLEATTAVFSPTHERSGTLADMMPHEVVHKISDAALLVRESNDVGAAYINTPVVVYRNTNGYVYCVASEAFKRTFKPVTK